MPYILYTKNDNLPLLLSEEEPLEGSFNESDMGLIEVTYEEALIAQDKSKVTKVVNGQLEVADTPQSELLQQIEAASDVGELKEIIKKLI